MNYMETTSTEYGCTNPKIGIYNASIKFCLYRADDDLIYAEPCDSHAEQFTYSLYDDDENCEVEHKLNGVHLTLNEYDQIHREDLCVSLLEKMGFETDTHREKITNLQTKQSRLNETKSRFNLLPDPQCDIIEHITDTISLNASHPMADTVLYVRAQFLRMSNGCIQVRYVDGNTFEALDCVYPVYVSRDDFSDRPWDACDSLVELRWALQLGGFEVE